MQEEFADWLAEENGAGDDLPVDGGLFRRLAPGVERRAPPSINKAAIPEEAMARAM